MTSPDSRRLVPLVVALVVALVALTSACGIRVPHSEVIHDAGADGSTVTSAQGADASRVTETGAGSALPGTAVIGASPSSGASAPAVASSGATTGSARSASAGAGARGTGGIANSAAGAQASGSPIAVGNIGTYSGVVGSSLSAGQPMVKIWAAWVNQHGGINGHQIVLYTADDGGDPSKAKALTQQMVEQDHVIAFVGDMIPITAAAVGDYLDQKKVPAVGGDVSAPDWNEHPMLFPQGTGALALYDESVALQAKFIQKAGGNKWGEMYCAEDAACTTSYDHAAAAAPKVGLNPVYGEKVTLSQPSYTAQCLNAQSKHVNIMVVTLDANSVNRVARDCSAQGFKPLYASGSVIVTSDLAKDPNLEGLTSIEPTFGWTYASSPAAEEYQAAISAISPNLNVSSATSAAWVSGKLLQTALAKVSSSGAVTAKDVLNGLYHLHDETVGGLAPPLNFVAGKPAPIAKCYFGVQIVKGAWVALNNGAAYC